ncbi:MAG: LysR family transcriptional regulator [Proteobacteria bacterium]|nr:LysR family transcriptional regulator [Pseudomonadota bacterium]
MRYDSIELRHIRYFLALAEELNFGRAAAKCHVSQPPFSVAIQQLESYLEAPLVRRNSRQVDLTPAGRAFREKAARLLAQASDAYDVAQSIAQGRQGVLRIGFHGSMVFRGLDRLMRRLAEQEPMLKIELREMSSQNQVDALISGQIDLGFGHSALVPSQLSFLTLFDEPLVACLPPDHLAATQRSLSLRQLEREPFILFQRVGSPAYFDRIITLCLDAGFTPNVNYQVSQWLTVVSMVAKRMGVAIVPQCLSTAGIDARFIALESKTASSPVQCMWLEAHDKPAVQAVLKHVQQCIYPPVFTPDSTSHP